ncbi:MAG TPA: exodeoxyribonuclease VII large subunit [Ignavibacteriaceae bacterium]|nr:exodeoxyribonuclease VII large subunit [Ignavibacteriaceae bacterium]
MSEEKQILTVSEITKEIRRTLEDSFSQVSVIGEISNFKAHYSGHWYFNLKDENAVINCTMWKGLNNFVFFTPQDGIKVIVTGRITVYPPRGNYQIDVRSMKPAGVGELQAAFEKLKQKLSDEGLFDDQYKKEIPAIPQRIGIVTAIDGAAIKDLISVAERRFPLVELIIAPAKVQGAGAAKSIVQCLHQLNALKNIDVIILARGGGSIEDLWAFNEEIVARAVFKSGIPIISGVGHETDFTIADFVADLRAPTPSVAMELATPDKQDFFAFIGDFLYNTSENISELIDIRKEIINQILGSYGFRFLLDRIRNNFQKLDGLIVKNSQSIERKTLILQNQISLLNQTVESYNIEKSLKKGFVLIKQNDKFISRQIYFDENLPATIKFFDGEIKVKKN